MAIYEYKGQQYEIATDDPTVAKTKILKHLGEQEAAPAEPSFTPTSDMGKQPAAGSAEAVLMGLTPKRESVLLGQKMPAASVEEAIRAGIRPEFINAVQAQLDAMPAEKRTVALAEMSKRGDVYGRAARTIAERYTKIDQTPSPTLKRAADRRLEAGTQQFIEQGMEPEAARGMAWAQAMEGEPTAPLQQARPDVVGEQADVEAAARAKELEGAGFLERVGAETRSRATKTGLGLISMYADITGDNEMAARAQGATRIEGARGEAIPKGESLFEKSAQGAISSLATQGPVLLLSAMTGTSALALAQAGIDVFGSEYGQGRSQGLPPQEAATRASLLAAAEVTFERFGLGEQLKAIRGALTHMPTDKIAAYLGKAIAKEIPAEQLTSATQFLIDKTPEIGLNRNAGWKEFWENQAETLRQTVIQAGAQSAGVVGTSKGLSYVADKLGNREQPYRRDELQGLAYQMLMREKGFLQPTSVPGLKAEAEAEAAPDLGLGALGEERPGADIEVQAPPAPVDTRIKQDTIDARAQQIAATLGIPEDDAQVVAKKQLMAEAQQLGKVMPTVTPVAEDARVSERAQEYIDQGMAQAEALQLATQEIEEENKADALAEAEEKGTANVAGPVTVPSGAGVPVAGQPSQVAPTTSVEGAEPTGVVPAGPNVAATQAGAAEQPTAVGLYERLGLPEGPARENARNEEISLDDAQLLKRMIVKTVDDGLAAGKTRQQIAAQLEALTKGGIKPSDFDRIHNYMTERGVKEEETSASEAPAPVAEPAKPRGRPKLAPEQKAASDEARRQQRVAANQATRNVDKAEALMQKAAEPLDPDAYETDEEFAEAEKEQRLNRAAAVRTLYQISRENKNKPGQRAAEILKGINPREVADAKAAYEYQKKRAAEQVSRSVQTPTGIEPVNKALTKVTNGAQAITQILKTGNAFQKMLAKRIRSFVGDVKVVVIEKGQELPEQLQRPKNLASWERSRGLYIENLKNRTRTVYVRGESFGEDQGVNTVTVLHELLHAAVNLKLGQALSAAKRGYSQNTQLARAYSDLLRTMNSAGSLFNDMAREGRLPKHISNIARGGNIFDDPREFVAYGMTDPEFQKFLMEARGFEEDTSYFTKFVDAIRRMLGMDEDSVNALSDLMVVTDKVLSAKLPADMRLAAYGMPEQTSQQALDEDEEEVRSQRQIHRAVSEALHKVNVSRTGEELGEAITALHAVKEPKLIIPYLNQAWAYADDNMRNAMAATPTFDFLARWTKDTVPELTNTNKLLEQMSGMSHQLLAKVGEMSESVLRAYKKDPTLRKKLENVVYASTLAQVDPSDPKAKERDKRLDTLYKDLGADGQRVYKMLRDYYRNMTEYYSHLLDKQIEDLDVSDETKKNLLAAVKTIYEGGQKITPYFPLVRRGDFWLSVGTGKTRQFYLFETKAERDNAAKELAAGQRTSLEELLDEKKFSLGNDVSVLRQASYQSSGLLRQIFDAIDNSNMSDPDARETLKDAVYQIYLQSMPEQSFRRQFIHRKGIAGFSTDLLRNINTTGAKTSVQLARIKYGPALRNSLAQARESIAPTPEYEPFVISAENRVRAALTAGRKGDSVDQAFEATAGVANKASYIWYLSGAASALIQPFSVYISGLPILSAHHSPAAAAKELAKMVTLMNQYGIVRQNADGTRSYLAPSLANNQDLPEDERRAIKEMLGRGVTQSTYASEVFGYKSTPSEALYFDPARGVIDNIPAAYGKTKRFVNILIAGLMHNTERLSREAIYLASYRLSRKAGKSHDQAVDQAVVDTNEALGNYDMTNRPVLMQKPGGKILLQFQMFPLHTSLLLLTNFKRMLPLLNKEGKREAAIKFFGIMGTAFSVAGLVGVPGFSAVMGLLGWAWKEFGKDDDWPEDLKSLDFETWFRTVFLPKELGADLALVLEHGPLNAATGLDFASRLSLNNLWGRDTKETKSTREGVIATALSHAGPTASMILSWADGLDAWNLGDTKKAAEKLTPAAARNVVVWKHMREEGVKDYRGAQLMSPEAIKTGELFGQIIGFRPALSADLQEKNFKLLGIENRINNERGKILIRLDNAYQARDMKAYRKAFEEVQDFNKGFPSYAIEPDDIASSLEKKQEQRGKSYRGIVPTEKNVPLIGDALVQSRKLVQQREKDVRKKD